MEETGLKIINPTLRGSFTWFNESNLAGTLYIFTATKYEGKLLETCNEGELRWHDLHNIENLKNLADHQKFFLNKILKDNNYFYTGLAIYNNGELLHYTDSQKYFNEKK